MNGFLEALKGDLLDRRLRPIVALVCVGLLGALVFTVFGGSNEAASSAASAHPAPVALASGVSITPSSGEDALAETTSSASATLPGGSHNPFGALPSTNTSSTGGSSVGSSSSGSSSSTGGSSSTSTGGSEPSGTSTTPSAPSKAITPSKPQTVYHVDVLFGEVPAGQEVSPSPSPRDDLKTLTPLPSIKVALLVYRGVRKGGKSATFTVSGEAILSGNGKCTPSPYDCEAISLKAGQSEHVQYLPPNSETAVTYELKLVSIRVGEASAAKVASLWRGESEAGLEVLRSGELMEVPGLRESAVAGVLLPAR